MCSCLTATMLLGPQLSILQGKDTPIPGLRTNWHYKLNNKKWKIQLWCHDQNSERQTTQILKLDSHVLTTQLDHKQWHWSKLSQITNSTTKYRICNFDPVIRIQKRNNKLWNLTARYNSIDECLVLVACPIRLHLLLCSGCASANLLFDKMATTLGDILM